MLHLLHFVLELLNLLKNPAGKFRHPREATHLTPNVGKTGRKKPPTNPRVTPGWIWPKFRIAGEVMGGPKCPGWFFNEFNPPLFI